MWRWVSAVAQRAAFGMARFARAPRKAGERRGRLLSDDRKTDGVVLIWALESALDAPKLLHALAQLSTVRTRVLVTTSLDIREASRTGCNVEVIPDASARALSADKDWSTYLERRFARIRESWDPDLEVTAGTPVDRFLTQLRAPDQKDPASASTRVSGIDGAQDIMSAD